MKRIIFTILVLINTNLICQDSTIDSVRVKNYIKHLKEKITSTIEKESPRLKAVILDSLRIRYKDGYFNQEIDTLAYNILKENDVKILFSPILYFSDSVRSIKSYDNIELYISDEFSVFKNGGYAFFIRNDTLLAFCPIHANERRERYRNIEGLDIRFELIIKNLGLDTNIMSKSEKSIYNIVRFETYGENKYKEHFREDSLFYFSIHNFLLYCSMDDSHIYAYMLSKKMHKMKYKSITNLSIKDYLTIRVIPIEIFIREVTYKYIRSF